MEALIRLGMGIFIGILIGLGLVWAGQRTYVARWDRVNTCERLFADAGATDAADISHFCEGE